MFRDHSFIITIEIDPEEIKTWSYNLEKWLNDNMSSLSNVKNGHVLQIKSWKTLTPIIEGYSSIITAKIQINAYVYQPQINDIITTEIKEITNTYAIMETDHARIWFSLNPVEAEKHRVKDKISVVIKAMKYSGTKFLLICEKP